MIYSSCPVVVNTNKVVLLAEGSRQPVGLGTVCDQGTIHNHRVPDGYIKVIIDYIKPKTRPPLPMPFDDEEELYCGQFAVWPKHCITSAT